MVIGFRNCSVPLTNSVIEAFASVRVSTIFEEDTFCKLINIDLSTENAINKHIFKESVDDFLDQSRYSEKKSR